jgi:hypothetical protein
MKYPRLAATLFFLTLSALFLHAQEDPTPPLGIQYDAKTGSVRIQWKPDGVPRELTVSDDLEKWLPWPGVPTGTSELTAEVPAKGSQEFFRLDPAVVPGKVFGLVATPLNTALSLHWERDPLVTQYTLYIGDDPDVGPKNFLQVVRGLRATDVILEGLTGGTTYYVLVQGENAKGTGPESGVVSPVFGRTGRVTGALGLAWVDAEGLPFSKPQAGVGIRLLTHPGGVEVARKETGTDGRFEIPDVGPGDYRVVWEGSPSHLDGGMKDAFQVGQGTFHLGDLVADAREGVLAGRVHFLGGLPAVFSDRVFQREIRATVTVLEKNGKIVASAEVDADGAFQIPPFGPDAYPIVVEARFGNVQTTAKVPSPAPGVGMDLVFPLEPPRVVSAVPTQDGIRVPIIDCGRPVTIQAQVESSGQESIAITWAAMTPAGRILATATGENPVFNLAVDRDTVIQFHGLVEPSSGIPTTIDFRAALSCGLMGRFTGRVAVWNETAAESLAPIAGATVRAKIGALVRSALTDAAGNFELVAVPHVGPMVLTIEKPGYVSWAWRFEGRPTEKEYAMIPVRTDASRIPAVGESTVNAGLFRFGVILPPGSFTADGAAYAGPVVLENAVIPLGNGFSHPFPPNPRMAIAENLEAISPSDYFWLDVRTPDGRRLTPVSGAAGPKIEYRTPTVVTRRLLRMDEARGVFVGMEVSGGMPVPPFQIFTFPMTHNGVLFGMQRQSLTAGSVIEISADRSLNYPFDVLVNNSRFPVTVHGPGQHDLGPFELNLFQTETTMTRFQVLDARQAPGAYYASLSDPVPRAAFRKTVVVDFEIPTGGIVSVLPVTPVRLGLGRTLPELTPPAAASGYGMSPTTSAPPWRVTSLEQPNAFLAPNASYAETASPHHAHIAETYYAAIRAPATLAAWKARNDFPASLTAVPASGAYVTTYYYNLGDLGFSRRLTMRKTVGYDGEPNIAMAVTNFRTIEEARDDIAPIATVCMEYSRRSPRDSQRFVKFTAFDENGLLANELSLDGGPARPMPNLCVMCHGGRPFEPVGRNPNLGSSFLPFDLESFTYHAKVGPQLEAFAALNQGVLDTDPAPAIRELIEGWYSTAMPFNAGFVPETWKSPAPAADIYHESFRTSCRVCHISRPESIQFDTYAKFQLMGGGIRRQVCLVSGGMPATQRTWSIFWGGRAGRKLQEAAVVPQTSTDYPAQLLDRAPLSNLTDLLRRR